MLSRCHHHHTSTPSLVSPPHVHTPGPRCLRPFATRGCCRGATSCRRVEPLTLSCCRFIRRSTLTRCGNKLTAKPGLAGHIDNVCGKWGGLAKDIENLCGKWGGLAKEIENVCEKWGGLAKDTENVWACGQAFSIPRPSWAHLLGALMCAEGPPAARTTHARSELLGSTKQPTCPGLATIDPG
eukprot:365161-Chlamydomonas_euryale.AAC.5